jgi:hypothetical protein
MIILQSQHNVPVIHVFKACLIAKQKFPLCHIQIMNSATDAATLIVMHDITFTEHTKVHLW